jgi:succinate-acetate transporter protein
VNKFNVLSDLGNTYLFALFGAYGGFWLSFAATLTPSLGAYGHYSTAYSATNPSAGLDDPTFAASFGFYLLAMAVLSFIFALGALRLNICLMIVEWGLTVCFGLLTATFWHLSEGNASVAGKCLTVSTSFTLAINLTPLLCVHCPGNSTC